MINESILELQQTLSLSRVRNQTQIGTILSAGSQVFRFVFFLGYIITKRCKTILCSNDSHFCKHKMSIYTYNKVGCCLWQRCFITIWVEILVFQQLGLVAHVWFVIGLHCTCVLCLLILLFISRVMSRLLCARLEALQLLNWTCSTRDRLRIRKFK